MENEFVKYMYRMIKSDMQSSIETQIKQYNQAVVLVSDIINRIYNSIVNKKPGTEESVIQNNLFYFIVAFDELYFKISASSSRSIDDHITNSRSSYGPDIIRSLMAFLCGQNAEYLNLLVCFSYKPYTDELLAQLDIGMRDQYSDKQAQEIIGYGG